MSFSKEVHAAAARINDTVENTARAVVLSWFNGTVRDTPVDEGTLQGNWQVSIGTPATGELSRRGASGPLGDISRTVRKPDNYWLANNKPYAAVAEYGRWGTGPGATEKTTRDGFSVQAPYGMARVNLARTKVNLRRLGVK